MKVIELYLAEEVMKFIDYIIRKQKEHEELYLTGKSYDYDGEYAYVENYSCISHTQTASWIWKYILSRAHGTELAVLTEEDVIIAKVEIWDNVTTVEIPDNMWDDYDWRL